MTITPHLPHLPQLEPPVLEAAHQVDGGLGVLGVGLVVFLKQLLEGVPQGFMVSLKHHLEGVVYHHSVELIQQQPLKDPKCQSEIITDDEIYLHLRLSVTKDSEVDSAMLVSLSSSFRTSYHQQLQIRPQLLYLVHPVFVNHHGTLYSLW